MSKNRMPRVAAITPTTEDRTDFNKRIERIFEAQDYPNKQHIIVMGGGSIGMKRNAAIKSTSADIIVCFDSDDIFMPDYISRCVERLQDCDTTGNSSAYFSDGVRSWLYEYKGKQKYVIGSGCAYWRRVWEKNPYQDTSRGEDTKFCANAGIIKPLDYLEGFVAQIHNSNTESQKALHLMKRVVLPKPLQQALESL